MASSTPGGSDLPVMGVNSARSSDGTCKIAFVACLLHKEHQPDRQKGRQAGRQKDR